MNNAESAIAWLKDLPLALWFVFAGLIVLFAAIAAKSPSRQEVPSDAHYSPDAPVKTFAETVEESRIATMVEDVSVTGWGVLWRFLIVINFLFSVIGLAEAKTVFQQMTSGIFLLSGSVACGLGIMLGRRKAYRIYRGSAEQ